MASSRDATGVFTNIQMRSKDECWPWLGGFGGRKRDPRPYFMCDGRRTMAYRVVYELVHGVTLNKSQLVLHSCDNGSAPVGCCNPHHLRLGDAKANAADMMARERYGLSVTAVKRILRMLDEGRTQAQIAEIHGVSRETVSAIATGRTYKHVNRWSVE